MILSLRAQLLLWFVAAVLFIAFAVTFLSQEITIWNLEKSIDANLQSRAHMVAAIVSSDITTDESSYAVLVEDLARQELPFVPLLLRIVSPTGDTITEFGDVPAPVADALDHQLRLSSSSDGRLDTMALKGIAPLRVYTIPVSDPRTRDILAFVQAVESLDQVEQAKRQLLRNGLIVGLGGGLLGAAAGLILIRRGFRPLRTILQAINEVDYHHLKTRLKDESRPAELEQLARSLTAMWQRLDLAVDQKQRHIGSMSHDIRTPLTALQGQLEVLLLQPSLNAATRDSLERMLRETHRLVRLLNNMLLNVQLESRPSLVTGEVNLRDLADEVAGDLWPLMQGLKLDINAPRDVTVYGDHDLLKQALMNLLDNAIKFTPAGGKVELTATGDEDWAIMEVTDNGPGIPGNDLPYVTEAFHRQAQHRRSAREGAGLGLSIVKQIVELHGGRLEIRSQEHVGTSAKMLLPRKLLIVLPEETPGQ